MRTIFSKRKTSFQRKPKFTKWIILWSKDNCDFIVILTIFLQLVYWAFNVSKESFPFSLFFKWKRKCLQKFFFVTIFRTSITLVVIQHQRTMSLKIIEHFAKHHNNQKVSFPFFVLKIYTAELSFECKSFFFLLHSLFP